MVPFWRLWDYSSCFWWEGLAVRGKLGLALVGRVKPFKSIIQLSADRWGLCCLPVNWLTWGDSILESAGCLWPLKHTYARTCLPGLLLPGPYSHSRATASFKPPLKISGSSTGRSGSFCRSLCPSRSFCTSFVCANQSLCFPQSWKFCNQIPLTFKVRIPENV